MRLLFVLPVVALSLAACGKKDPLGCANDAACPGGHACVKGACTQVCDFDTDCAAGTICESNLCIAGERQKPQMTRVRGDGTNACADSTGSPCFTDHLIIDGQRLLGSTFTLRGLEDVSLPVVGSPSGVSVSVALPASLQAGEYTLVAQNQAGSDELPVNILQGEPGAAGPDATGTQLMVRLNDATTVGRLIVERMPAANPLIAHLNTGDGSVKISASLLPITGGGALADGNEVVGLINDAATTDKINANRLSLSGSALISAINAGSGTIDAARLADGNALMSRINGGTTRLDADLVPRNAYHVSRGVGSYGSAAGDTLDDTAIRELCADGDGCSVSIGYRYFEPDVAGGKVMVAPFFGPPCRFWLDDDRQWSLGGNCNWRYYVYDTPTTSALYGPYASGVWGQDGPAGGAGDSRIVLEYAAYDKWVCMFGEVYSTTTNASNLSTDTTNGFYFWMSSETLNTANVAFRNANRTCELVIND